MASWPWMDDSWLTGLKCSCYSCGSCYVTIFKHCFSKIYCQSAESAIAIEHNYSEPSSDGAFSYTRKCCSSPYHSLPTDLHHKADLPCLQTNFTPSPEIWRSCDSWQDIAYEVHTFCCCKWNSPIAKWKFSPPGYVSSYASDICSH